MTVILVGGLNVPPLMVKLAKFIFVNTDPLNVPASWVQE